MTVKVASPSVIAQAKLCINMSGKLPPSFHFSTYSLHMFQGNLQTLRQKEKRFWNPCNKQGNVIVGYIYKSSYKIHCLFKNSFFGWWASTKLYHLSGSHLKIGQNNIINIWMKDKDCQIMQGPVDEQVTFYLFPWSIALC